MNDEEFNAKMLKLEFQLGYQKAIGDMLKAILKMQSDEGARTP